MSRREFERLLTPAEVATFFHVDPKTVTRWARNGRLPVAGHTPGGHRRYREADVRAMFDGTAPCARCTYPVGSPGHRIVCLGAAS